MITDNVRSYLNSRHSRFLTAWIRLRKIHRGRDTFVAPLFMKPLLLLLVSLLSATAWGANPIQPFSFKFGQVAFPSLSLQELRPLGPVSALPCSRSATTPLHFSGQRDLLAINPLARSFARRKPLFSRAPNEHPMIKRPDDRFDYKLIIEPPDDAYDYKLLIKELKPDAAK